MATAQPQKERERRSNVVISSGRNARRRKLALQYTVVKTISQEGVHRVSEAV